MHFWIARLRTVGSHAQVRRSREFAVTFSAAPPNPNSHHVFLVVQVSGPQYGPF